MAQRRRCWGVVVTLVATASLCVGVAPSPSGASHTFPDVSAANVFHSDIDWLVQQNIVSGYLDGTYRPHNIVSRQVITVVLERYQGALATSRYHALEPQWPMFFDVWQDHPFYQPIVWAATEGYIDGYADDMFHPEEALTRGDLALALTRFVGVRDPVPPAEPRFSDVDPAHPAYAAIEWLAANGVIGGYRDGTFRPEGSVKRQHLARFLASLDSYLDRVCSQQSDVPTSECAALQALFFSSYGTNWSRRDGWLRMSPPCSWFGVTCSDGHVTRIELPSNRLRDRLPAALADLAHLEVLDLSRNKLEYGLGPAIDHLTALRVLDLERNRLHGIPASIGTLSSLQHLDLSDNWVDESQWLHGDDSWDWGLSGALPPELGLLSELVYLDLGNNPFLSGPIPPELGALAKLEHLDLGWTANGFKIGRLGGTLPEEIWQLRNLRYLNVSIQPGLATSLPPAVGDLTNLAVLRLAVTDLSGTIPPEIGDLAALRELELSNSWYINGEPPDAIGLTGTIPAEIGNLLELEVLGLGSHYLTGDVPEALMGLPKLTGLSLCGNTLTAPTPEMAAWLDAIDPGWRWGGC